MAGVDIREIEKSFGDTPVLKSVSLDIQDREFMTLVGPSGCGKSTLLRIVAGLERQDGGSILVGGTSVDHLRPRKRDVAMVFQSYALYPHLTVFENIAVPLRMRRTTALQRLPLAGRFMPGSAPIREAIEVDVVQIARSLDIEPLLNRKPGQLSGGQRQRVALGRAMVRNPQVFLMDEPLSNLDAKLRVHMRTEIAQLHRQLETTFVYVTHDQAEAMTMSDRLAVMMDGDILQVASPEEVYRNPKDIRVAEFIGSPKINVMPGAVRGDGGIELLGRPLGLRAPAAGAGAVDIGLRPEHLRVAPAEGSAVRDLLAGRVVHRENLGSELLVHVGLDTLSDAVVVRSDPENADWIVRDAAVGLLAPSEKALVFSAEGARVATHVEPQLAQVAHG